MSMLSEELFHYTKAATALEYILAGKKQIKFSQLQYTNDPKESKELIFGSFTGVIPQQSIQVPLDKMQAIANSIKLKEWKVLCFSQNHSDLTSGKMSIIDRPFLSGKFKPAMWAHYSGVVNGQHNGVCLKFNKSKLDAKIQETFQDKTVYRIYSGKVEYNDEKLFDLLPLSLDQITTITETEIEHRARDYFIEYHDELFFRKSNDWERENEFRWLVQSKKDSPEYVSIDGTLEEVFVGQDFPQVYEPSLIAACKELGVPTTKVCWSGGVPYEKPIYRAS